MKRLAFLCRYEINQFFTRVLQLFLCGSFVSILTFGGTVQQPSAPQRPVAKPASTPQPNPTPAATLLVPLAGPSPTSRPLQVDTPSPQPTPQAQPTVQQATPAPSPFSTPQGPTQSPLTSTGQTTAPLRLDDALRLANAEASAFQQAGLNEQIAAEEVKQAQLAFLPRVTAPIDYIFTSPLLGAPAGTPRAPSFIANNAVNEYQAFMNVAGDIDIAGRLRATLAKNRALLAAAHAGTEVARRA
ncbi:MAG TPA: hypothetical protein VIV66_17695, partial [Pyrinomonadaceae bacterium]